MARWRPQEMWHRIGADNRHRYVPVYREPSRVAAAVRGRAMAGADRHGIVRQHQYSQLPAAGAELSRWDDGARQHGAQPLCLFRRFRAAIRSRCGDRLVRARGPGELSALRVPNKLCRCLRHPSGKLVLVPKTRQTLLGLPSGRSWNLRLSVFAICRAVADIPYRN